jgi:hypothetical protein
VQVNFSQIHGYDSSNTYWFVAFNSSYDKDSILSIPEFKSRTVTLEPRPVASLTPDKKLVGLDANKAFHTIKTHGYYIFGSKIEVAEL